VAPAFPSSTGTLLTDNRGGASSSTMVAVPVPTAIWPLVTGTASWSANVSSSSSTASPSTVTLTVCSVSRPGKMAVPDTAM
jgi:hypothetical protein